MEFYLSQNFVDTFLEEDDIKTFIYKKKKKNEFSQSKISLNLPAIARHIVLKWDDKK